MMIKSLSPCQDQQVSNSYWLPLAWKSAKAQFSPLALAVAVLLNGGQFASATEPTKLPQTQVFGQALSLHDVASESELVGPASQPEWTTRRVFAETDVYVIPSGEIEFNQFYISSHPRHEKPGNLFETELEFGLPWRTQFDVELSYGIEEGNLVYDSTMIELPHALADWGKIPFNPAINAGWRFTAEDSDSYIFSLLLAEQFGDRFHFGGNLSFERQVAGELETVYELTSALSCTLIDNKLSLGAQLVVEYETAQEREFDAEDNARETESEYSTEVLLGPSLLYRPTKNIYLGLTPLFGLTRESSTVEAYVLLGIDFEPFSRVSSKEEDRGNENRLPSLRRPR